MISKDTARALLGRMRRIRGCMLKDYPFYGELAMGLELGVGQIGTALTDMKRLVVDPAFADTLSDDQLVFVFMHEVLHCVLFHCVRGKGRDRFLWNVACDIVVNSNILQNLGQTELVLGGHPVMHLDPQGMEGYRSTAEEVYDRLLTAPPVWLPVPPSGQGGDFAYAPLDNHEFWDDVNLEESEIDQWNQTTLAAAGKWAGKREAVAAGILKELESMLYRRQLKWKQICRDFVRRRERGYDYNYRPPDRRFLEEEFLYPGLNPTEDDVIEELLFCVDKSGSITVKEILVVMKEIENALRQVKGLTGKLMFFDVKVTEPIGFSNARELLRKGVPQPGGGTDFHIIFRYIHKNMKSKKTSGVVILTDGYADFPTQAEIKGLPTLWVIIDSERNPSCGKCVHIQSESLFF